MKAGIEIRRRGGWMRLALVVLAAFVGLAWSVPSAMALPGDPIFLFAPVAPPPPEPAQPAPTGFFNDPCGLAVDGSGRFWVSDYYHRAVSVFSSNADFESQPLAAFNQPVPHSGSVDDPCALALDSSSTLYVNNYHRNVVRFSTPHSLGSGTVLSGSAGATGVAINPLNDYVYVAKRDAVAVYEPNGTHAFDVGLGDLGEAYGVAVSGYGSTAGYVYVPDASNDTLRVYDPASDLVNPVEVIDGSATPNGGFVSLRDAAVAVDDVSGKVYMTDSQNPAFTESPQSTVYSFDSTGAYEGHLKRNVFDGAPTGLAVDNSGTGTQGRIYVTTGNTHHSGVYAYPPDQEQTTQPLSPTIPEPPLGSGLLFKTVTIGGPVSETSGCEGDGCQALPPEPGDPTLTTLLEGLGNPKIRYRNSLHNCAVIAKELRELEARIRRLSARLKRAATAGQKRGLSTTVRELRRRAARKARGAKACRQASGSRVARVSASASATRVGSPTSRSGEESDDATAATEAHSQGTGASSPAVSTTRGLIPGAEGFDAAVYANGGGLTTLAGSHPYQVDLNVALDQSGGGADLRELRLRLPPGLLLNPANGTGVLCQSSAFTTPRTPPFPAGSESGESCHDRSQVGTVEVTTGIGGGQTRRFGLFNLQPDAGTAARFGASPFGVPLVFDATINADVPGTYVDLDAGEIPQGLEIQALKVSLWGVPWDASHNSERGDCLNEEEAGFAWAKCSVGEPTTAKPRAFLTLPTECGTSLTFGVDAGSWQQPGVGSTTATSGGPVTGCETLGFDLDSEGLLSVTKASSASGFVFRFDNEDEAFTNPRERAASLVKRLVVELPQGVTLNPSVGAGLGVCTPAQLRGRDRHQRARRRLPERLEDRRLHRPPALLRGPPEGRRSTWPSPTTPAPRRREPLRLAARRLPGRQVGRPRHPGQASRASSSPTPATAPSPRPSTTCPSSPTPTSRSTSAPASGRRSSPRPSAGRRARGSR